MTRYASAMARTQEYTIKQIVVKACKDVLLILKL